MRQINERMLPLVIVCMALASAASRANAQERQFGAKVGPSFSILEFDPSLGNDYDRRAAAGGGGFLVLPLGRQFAVQLEALLDPKGAKLNVPEEPGITRTVMLRYADFPALVRMQGPHSRSLSLHAFGGRYAGIRVSAKRQISSVTRSITSGAKEDMSSEVKRFESGIIGGAGVDIGQRLLIDGRYSRGLTGVNTEQPDGIQIRTRAFSMMVGVRF
jgi:Outer membrane protein beta-barrel domain